MTTSQFDRFLAGPIDKIDASLFSGDMFHDKENIAELRSMMARWERGLKECEEIIDEQEELSVSDINDLYGVNLLNCDIDDIPGNRD